MNAHQPQLPLAYEPIRLDDGANVKAYSIQLGLDGAEEGTLVWATRQAEAEARPGNTWYSPDDGLYLGLVLEPDFPTEQAGQLALVGLVSMGLSMAEHVVPMTDLAYRWPNDILLSGSKVAGLWLSANEAGDRLVLNLAVNVAKAPQQVIDAGCVQTDGATPETTPEILLETFARQFLDWINRWAEEGMAPILRQVRSRHAKPGTPVLLRLDRGEHLAGSVVEIAEQGQLVLETDGQTRSVALNEFFGLK